MHSHGSDGGSRRNRERHLLGHTGRVDVLATLDVGSSAIFLRRARPGDVAAIVGLLAAAVRVDQAYRSCGVGHAMFTWAISEARRRGCALIQLTTDKVRTDAHRFYERLGFVASHEGLKLILDRG